MAKLVIWVSVAVKPVVVDAYRRAIMANARASVADEPGCLRFDVLIPEDGSGEQIRLYEIYESAAAFDAHLQTPHFAAYQKATADLISEQSISRLHLVA